VSHRTEGGGGEDRGHRDPRSTERKVEGSDLPMISFGER
jgi:hypothetical protein